MRSTLTVAVIFIVAAAPTRADERLKGIACRSVHLAYPAPECVAFYNELTVEKSADGTYFMAAGWSKGYFGIQELASGKKLVLFSVWDPTSGDNPKNVDDSNARKCSTKTTPSAFGGSAARGPEGNRFLTTIGRSARHTDSS